MDLKARRLFLLVINIRKFIIVKLAIIAKAHFMIAAAAAAVELVKQGSLKLACPGDETAA